MKFEDEGIYFVMSPDSTIRAVWDLTLFTAIIYQSLCLPMRIAFEMSSGDFIFYLEMVIDAMFIIDVVLNFNTGFYI